MILWAIRSYRRTQDQTSRDLRQAAEVDLLHARLNQIAAKVGAPLVRLDYELEHAIGSRIERVAHFAGLDEFRVEAHTGDGGDEFWTNEALGYADIGESRDD